MEVGEVVAGFVVAVVDELVAAEAPELPEAVIIDQHFASPAEQ